MSSTTIGNSNTTAASGGDGSTTTAPSTPATSLKEVSEAWAASFGGPIRTAEESFSGLLCGAPEAAVRQEPPDFFNKWVEPRSTIQRVRIVVDGDAKGATNTASTGRSRGTSAFRTSTYDEKDGWMEHPWVVQWIRTATISPIPGTAGVHTPILSKGGGYHQVQYGPYTWELDPARATKAPGTVRVCCVSDTHNYHDKLDVFIPADGSIDLMVHGGDFSDVGSQEDVASFCEWIRKIRASHKIPEVAVIGGNHDLSLDYPFYEEAYVRFGCQRLAKNRTIDAMRSCCMYLDHQGVVTDSSLKVYGSPYQPEFHSWAFNLPRGTTRGGCREKWASMPKAAMDILLTHGPPMGHGDWVFNYKHERERFGCPDLLDFVEAYPPKVHVFGHIHEGHGVTFNGKSLFVNASSMNENYDALNVNVPVIIDIPI